MADMKTTIIKSLEKGSQTLAEIEVLRKTGNDFRFASAETTKKIESLHKNLRLRVEEAYMNTPYSRTLKLVAVDGTLPSFESGQYINVYTTIEGIRTSRPYSLSSPANQRGYYEICVARIDGGFVSDYIIDEVKVGDVLETSSPAGSFHFHPVFHKKKSVFIAGGSGITPFVSMIKEVLESGIDRQLHLIYGVANTSTIIYKDDLEYLAKNYENFRYDLVYSEPEESWNGYKGFVTKELLAELVSDIKGSTYYICGPQVMNLSVEKSLKELGVRPAMIRREMFSQNQNIHLLPAWPEGLAPEKEFKVKVNDRGEIKEIMAKAGESLLISMERNKIRVDVCCRSGECSLCRVQVVDGETFLVQGSLQRRTDEKFGYVHSCKAYPISDLEILI